MKHKSTLWAEVGRAKWKLLQGVNRLTLEGDSRHHRCVNYFNWARARIRDSCSTASDTISHISCCAVLTSVLVRLPASRVARD